MRQRVLQVASLSLAFLVGCAAGGAGLYLRYRDRIRPHLSTRAKVAGEVFLQARSGEALTAPGAAVYVWPTISPRGEHWAAIMSRAIALQAESKTKHGELVRALQAEALRVYSEVELDSQSKAKISQDLGPAYSVSCDSMGRFAVDLPLGSYVFVATGRAGANEVVWTKIVEVRQDVSVPLSDAIVSYFDNQ